MARASVYEITKQNRGLERSVKGQDYSNEVADTYRVQLEDLAGEILPQEFGRPFTGEQADFYVSERRWLSGRKKPSVAFPHEEFLHQLFWPAFDNRNPVLIIEGPEGVGKSTLLRYYFDCFLYQASSPPKGAATAIDPRAMITLYVPLRHEPSEEDVKQKITSTFSREIRNRFPSITTENDFAMWDSLVDWDDDMHQLASDAYASRSVYRANYVSHHYRLDSVEFVTAALAYLSNQLDERGQRRYWISLIFDDLDQQLLNVQESITKLIISWLQIWPKRSPDRACEVKDLNIWKVILPLRPETLRALMIFLEPIPDRDIFRIGAVNQEILLKTRARKLENAIRTSGKTVQRNYRVNNSGTIVYNPLPTFIAAKRMTQMLTFSVEHVISDASSGTTLKPGAATRDFLEDFSNQSIRRFLRLRKRLASSIVIEKATEHALRHHLVYFQHYAFMDGLLTGGRDHFEPNDPDNDVVNLYNTIQDQQEQSPYSFLIGCHTLFLLLTHNFSAHELGEELSGIGYSLKQVGDCLQTLLARGVLRYTRGPFADQSPIHKEMNVLNAHLFLLTDSAYTDNMAIVTPVDTEFHRDMKPTVSFNRDEFKSRVKNTLAFLRQIQKDEQAVRMPSASSTLNPTTVECNIERLGLPKIYEMVARSYREGLLNLKEMRGALRAVMKDSDWRELLEDDVLRTVESA